MSTLQTAAILLALFLTVPLAGGLAVALHDAAAERLIPWLTNRALPRLRALRARHQPHPTPVARANRSTERRWEPENVAALARGTRNARSGRRSA